MSDISDGLEDLINSVFVDNAYIGNWFFYYPIIMLLDFFKVWQHSIKKVGKWMSLCCTLGYKWVTVMYGVKFELMNL